MLIKFDKHIFFKVPLNKFKTSIHSLLHFSMNTNKKNFCNFFALRMYTETRNRKWKKKVDLKVGYIALKTQ